MTQNSSQVPSYLQPRPKAPAILNTTSLAATASGRPELKRESSQARRQDVNKATTDTSDKATAALIRRVLCAHQVHTCDEKDRVILRPIDELLPPLTSSNDIDLQLYAFIAIIVKEFVYSWYSKITPDHAFVDEVIQIIAHCTRALEQRLRSLDLEALLLDEIPELLLAHVQAYRTSHYPLHPPPLIPDPWETYHALHPHPALFPVPHPYEPSAVLEQQQNETAYRQLLVQGALAVILPTEDLENPCLRALVAEVFGEMILGNGVGGKACEGWLLWEGIMKIAENLKARRPKGTIDIKEQSRRISRLEEFGLLSSEATAKSPAVIRHSEFQGLTSVSTVFWCMMQYAYIAFTVLRFIVMDVATSSSLPSRSQSTSPPQSRTPVIDSDQAPATRGSPPSTKAAPPKQPILGMKIWSCISLLFEMDVRMPWLTGFLSLIQWGAIAGYGRVGNTDGTLDKILSHHIHTKILTPANLPPILLTLRTALFPSNTLTAARPIPTASEIAAIKSGCATTLLSLLPSAVSNVYFGGTPITNDHDGGREGEAEETKRKEVEELLDVLGDAYCNKHLVYGIVELVLVRLMPELGRESPSHLTEARLT
ncbi:MAG: hypothetical protein M1827_004813 [Pycnora praestabilis]|nr:MAG: hypothetical protein M1827_004813 [Pycnora praestabilis]